MQWLGWAVLCFPFAIFFAITGLTAVNIPIQDDYDAIGNFLEKYSTLHGFWQRAWFVLTAQHTQYKLIFLHTIVALQYQLIGHTNYKFLELLGNLGIPAVVLLLWMFLARSRRPLLQRTWLFVAPCYLFFTTRYVETLNWSMSGLQNIAIVPISLATFYAASSSSRYATWLTAAFLVLSIATSGNGFFVAAVLCLLLVFERRYRDAAITVVLTTAMAALYAVRYQILPAYSPIPLHQALRIIPRFPFAFLGNCAYSSGEAVALGLVLVAGFLFLTWRGWPRVCPGTFGAAFFCVVTALGVTATRYRGGLDGAMAPRYAMYSLLLIALEYIAAVRLFVPSSLRIRSRTVAALAAAAIAAICFYLPANARAYRELHARQRLLITHLILWQRHPDHLVLVPDEEKWVWSPEWIQLRTRFQSDLRRQINAGLYIPPYTASAPLPLRPHSPSTLGIENEPPPPAK